MDDLDSFGEWLRQRREALRLTRPELAECVGCSVSALRKIEADERRPSRQLAELLAGCLHIPPEAQPTFLEAARGMRRVTRLGAPAPQVVPPPAAPPPASPGSSVSPQRVRPAWNLPAPATPLLGREAELAALAQLLGDPDCRLLTLVGPGGIGKTRLAIEVACDVWDRFADGVFLASLAGTSSSEFMVPTIAQAVGLNFAGPADPRSQLVNYLRNKQVLLLLDNLEHLLDGVDLVVEMLERAPRLKLLATSRERLELQAEWGFEVQGLPVPAEGEVEELEKYSAVQLFLQRARQAQIDFQLSGEDHLHVARICRLVEGMPLAIELAAAWVPVLVCAEIADEIELSIDFLTTTMRDVPERQRSLRATFTHSWKLLTEEERRVLRQFSVFRGGFQRQAAEQVADASLPVLSSLVSRSLLRHSATGRYDVHELIRWYAASKLAEDPHELHAAQERHSNYYLDLLEKTDTRLKSSHQKQALTELTGEIDNIRAAWDWSVAAQRFIPLYNASATLMYFFTLLNWFQEGEVTFQKTANALRATMSGTDTDTRRQVAFYAMLAHYGYFIVRLGRGAEAYAVLSPSVAYLRTSGEPLATIYSLMYLGMVCWVLGRFAEAKESLQENLRLARQNELRWYAAKASEYLGSVALQQGEYNQARQYLSEALLIMRQLGDPSMTAPMLRYLASTMQSTGEFREAEKLLQESLEIAREIGFGFAIGFALDGLGKLAYAQGSYEKARVYFSECTSLFREMGDNHRLLRTLNHQGLNALALKRNCDAQNDFISSLRMAYEGGFIPPALNALAGLAALGTRQKPGQGTLELVICILEHSASTQETKTLAARLRVELESKLTQEEIKAAWERAGLMDLDELVGQFLSGA